LVGKLKSVHKTRTKENECKDKDEQEKDDPQAEEVNSSSNDATGEEQDEEEEEDEEEEDAAQDDPAAAAAAGVGLDDDELLPEGQPENVKASVPASKPAGAGVTKAVRKNSKGPSATAVAAERSVKDKNPSPRGVVLGSGEKPRKGSKNERSEGGDDEADAERPLVKKLKLAVRGYSSINDCLFCVSPH
jgi:hypothetical protein